MNNNDLAQQIYSNLEEIISAYSFTAVTFGTIVIIVLSIVSLVLKPQNEVAKKMLFGTIAATVILTTIFLAGVTIYLNTVSSSKGPVHWHADIEIWSCGKEVDFKDPKGLSNKIGTATLHEHNDKRIHLEGVVVKPLDASLGKFFRVIGGEITDTSITFPINDGTRTLTTGDLCDNGERAELQVFVFKTEGKRYTQTRLDSPDTYVMSPYSTVPPGDCVIIEFDAPKPKTDKMCRSYKVALELGKLEGEQLR